MQPAVRTLYGLVVRCDPGSEADPTAMKHDRSVKIRSTKLRPAGSSDGETEDNAPVNVDAILQSILGREANVLAWPPPFCGASVSSPEAPQGFLRFSME